MPPRSAKKRASAKKATPKRKREVLESSAHQDVPASAVEDEQVSEQVVERTTSVEVETWQEEEVLTEKALESAEASPRTDHVAIVVEEEASMSSVVVEETEVAEELDEEKNLENANEGDHMDREKGATQDLVEKLADIDGHRGEDRDDITDDNENIKGEEEGDESGSDNEDGEEDEDASLYMQAPLTADRKKPKELEIFVGGLDRRAVEDDLIKVFGVFGEIQAVRIVKHPITHKSKGFAFIRYATVEQAKKALTELKDGTEVRGKRVGISLSQDSDTLYMGNICKTWAKEQVLEMLKSFGIEQIEEFYLPDNPKKEGKNRGFALLEFSTHSDAMAAFQRLRKPDALFGCDRSAKVAFAQSMHPSEEALLQVKTVYIDGLTDSWDEEKLKKLCEQYGEVEKVQLSRTFVAAKRKDFGFVSFVSRESAIACVEGINKSQIGEVDVKVKANLAKPQYKGRLGKKAARGGYKVQKDGEKSVEAEPTKNKGKTKSKGPQGKGKAPAKANNAKWSNAHNPRSSSVDRQGADAPSKLDKTNNQRKEQPAKSGKRGRRSMDTSHSGRPSKKLRGSIRGKPAGSFGNIRKSSYAGNAGQNYSMTPAMHAVPNAHGYVAPASSYQGHAYGTVSGSTHHYSDMEPHAGYIVPAAAKRARDSHGYGLQRAGAHEGQGSISTPYVGAPVPPNSYVHGYSNYAGYQSGGSSTGHVYPQSGAYPYQPAYY